MVHCHPPAAFDVILPLIEEIFLYPTCDGQGIFQNIPKRGWVCEMACRDVRINTINKFHGQVKTKN